MRLARDASIPSTLAIAISVLATQLPLEEAPRARALYDEAIAVGTRSGDRPGVARSILLQGWLAARTGQWRAALEAAVESAERLVEVNDGTAVRGSYTLAAVSLTELGSPAAGAVMLGAGGYDGRTFDDGASIVIAAAHASQIESLDEDRVAELMVHGATFTPSEKVTRLRAEADRVLDA